jgi:hypothetical protein
MWDNADRELKRLNSKQCALETTINEKQSLRNTLQFQYQKSEAGHREAFDAFNVLGHEVALQRQRVLLAKNTPIHTEMEEELTRLSNEHESAHATLSGAQKDLEHTKHALAESDSVLTECDQHRAELQQVNADIETMETLRQEWKQRRGLEVAQLVHDSINAAQDYQRQVKEASEARLLSAIGQIESELAEWPELAERIAETFRESVEDGEEDSPSQIEEVQADPSDAEEHKDDPYLPTNPMIRVLEAWLAFLQVLREDGHKAKFYETGKTWIIDALALPQGRLRHFMQPGNWIKVRKRDAASWQDSYQWTHTELEVIQQTIDQEREKERYSRWQALPSGREWE